MKIYQFPDSYTRWIEDTLKSCSHTLNKPKKLAEAILNVSDHYQDEDSKSLWEKNSFVAAYFSYYFPLNYIRSLKVFDEAKSLGFFDDNNKVIDFGCGPGTMSKALFDSDVPVESFFGVDSSNSMKKYYTQYFNTKSKVLFEPKILDINLSNKALLASYVFNEMDELPHWLLKLDSHIIIEPATHQASQNFQKLRNQFIENGFSIWAPCPHHSACPLAQSKKDWCHDRVHWEKPSWFSKIEEYMPIKNDTLTMSYLLVKKKPPPKSYPTRIVGDALVEKGKTRWMLCQNSERQFLSFLHRNGKPPKLYRGERIEVSGLEEKGNELRMSKESLLEKLK